MNGRPIFGQLDLTDVDANDCRVNAILGRAVPFGARVRVTGVLVLDCGHGWTRPCDEDDAGTQNQEIHPVYALDVVQDFRQPRPFANLTGVWSANDAGTYYVREIGNTVWWLGVSSNEGRAFANVFKGTLDSGLLTGEWADVPLGATSGSGALMLFAGPAGPTSTVLLRNTVTGGFSGWSWQKLYDEGTRRIIVVFESATAGGQLPASDRPEPFELAVGDRRLEARPTNPRKVPAPGGGPASQVTLAARVQVNASQAGPLQISARYAGYRAAWSIPTDARLKPGVYVQDMTAPSRLPESFGESAGRPAGLLPKLSITYRVEVAEGPER